VRAFAKCVPKTLRLSGLRVRGEAGSLPLARWSERGISFFLRDLCASAFPSSGRVLKHRETEDAEKTGMVARRAVSRIDRPRVPPPRLGWSLALPWDGSRQAAFLFLWQKLPTDGLAVIRKRAKRPNPVPPSPAELISPDPHDLPRRAT